MKWNFKRDIFALALIAASIIIAFYYYSILPQTVASHFNAEGSPDGYSSKISLVLIGTGIPIVLYFLLTFIPFIDPFKKKIEKNYNIFLLFRDLAIAFTIFMMTLTFISAKEGTFQSNLFGIGFGLLFILLGNYLPKLPRNFFFGIRSPWTLASDVVWYRTHRISGGLFVIGGVLIVILTLFKVNLVISMSVVLTPLIIYTAFVYPYSLYRKLQKEGKQTNPDL
ncbi:MAG: SdpI family protein [Ignavibacteriaceae bacterium]